MKNIFKGIEQQNIDTNTRQQMSEDGWRIATGEEETAFMGYYLYHTGLTKIYDWLARISVMFALFFVGDFGFEYMFRSSGEFHPTSIYVRCMLSIAALILCIALRKQKRRSAKKGIENHVYVIDALANQTTADQIYLTIHRNSYEHELFRFKESVNPMDYVHDDTGRRVGFRVRLYLYINHGKVVKKVVLGSDGYRSCYEQMRK